MSEFILMIILVATTAYVAMPYWQRRVVVKTNSKEGHIADLLERRDNLLAAIKEIEFDYETGKISPEDFAEMNAKYRTQAVSVLKRIDAASGNKRAASEKLEAELRQLRNKKKAKGVKFCPNCGHPANRRDNFCSRCGSRLIS